MYDISDIFDITKSKEICDADISAIFYILLKKRKKLMQCEFHPRVLIDILKNEHKHLEYLLKFMKKKDFYVGAGGYFYEDIKDNITFDLYKKYDVYACNCSKDHMSDEQWSYLYEIDYINEEQFKKGWA
jgi:hypothetical protein